MEPKAEGNKSQAKRGAEWQGGGGMIPFRESAAAPPSAAEPESADVTFEDVIAWLKSVVMTPPGCLTKMSSLAQEFTEELSIRRGRGGDGEETETLRLRVKLVNKLAALKMLCQLMGWKEPKAPPQVDTLAEWVNAMREGQSSASA